ncbi:MAG: phosphoenolpyruvate carboxykinase (ATP) [bacterium]|nr:phosphoenolpyruvate carboxykinase (ATP) [bacterium]
MAQGIDLQQYGLTGKQVHRNLSPAELYEHGLEYDGSSLTSTGALVAISGAKTGRSPKDKRIVDNPECHDKIWWGNINMPLSADSFEKNRTIAIDYLNSRERLYVVDGFAGWDPRYRLSIRIICSRPYHALFMHNMLMRPNTEELRGFGEPDYVIFNAGAQPADSSVDGVESDASVAINFEKSEFVILGTQYAGEMKKGVFSIMHYLMPDKGVLSMHCSANMGHDQDVSIFFGLSGTGKTTLSADPKRLLIGDDEHCWSEQGVFNIEGGCYAKAIDLSAEHEPDIFKAIRFGTVLENVVYDEHTREVDYTNNTLTENTRASYPIHYIPNTVEPCVGGHPNNIIFLTCDAFGVLPPVSRLSPEQAMQQFLAGYTAKVAGTEVGVTEPEATFSACFGAAFLVRHPKVYGEMLAKKMEAHGTNAWLVNTGWSGGGYGVGKRMRLPWTRAIIDAIHDGSLADAETKLDPNFGLNVPTSCAGVPAEILDPKNTWVDPTAYDEAAKKLAKLFSDNEAKFD